MIEPLTYEPHHCPPDCPEHPPCPFCGGVLVDEGDRVVCRQCGTDAEVGADVRERVPS